MGFSIPKHFYKIIIFPKVKTVLVRATAEDWSTKSLCEIFHQQLIKKPLLEKKKRKTYQVSIECAAQDKYGNPIGKRVKWKT